MPTAVDFSTSSFLSRNADSGFSCCGLPRLKSRPARSNRSNAAQQRRRDMELTHKSRGLKEFSADDSDSAEALPENGATVTKTVTIERAKPGKNEEFGISQKPA